VALPPVSRERIVDAMTVFDREQRDVEEWRDWQSNANYEYAIQFEGQLYPVKQIISMATGAPKDSFSGGPESNAYLEKLDFNVVRLREDGQAYLLLRSMPGVRWQDAPGLSYHFGDTVPNHKRVVPGASVVIDTRFNHGRTVIGSGTIAEVKELPRGPKGREFEAIYSTYEPLRPPRPITRELDAELRAMPGYNVQHSIRRLTPEMFDKLARPPSAWVFAGNSQNNDFDSLVKLDRFTWSVNAHKNSIGVGDRVYVYRYGNDGGIVAVGEVAEPATLRARISQDRKYLRNEELLGEADRALVNLTAPIDPILGRDELIGAGLSDLAVLKAQGGTNFQVTPEEAATIEKLIESRIVVAEPPPTLPETLTQVVDSFAATTKAAGLDYGEQHRQLVVRLLASLLTRPFVILTGLSGSGKSQLALKLGQWFGKEQYSVVAVRPDWTGPEAMLGYEDLLQPPPRPWVVGEVLKISLRAAANPDRPYLLLLDEMNLAHVERYFADFLSGMESDEPVIPNLAEGEDSWRLADPKQPKLRVPRNLFVVGTVNVDETTYMFSPKVLDRANTIEFRVRSEDLSHAGGKPGDIKEADLAPLATLVTAALDSNWHAEHRPSGLVNTRRR
jgi:EVE domain